MSDDVKPYTRESIEHGLREVRNGLRADATIAEVGRAIEALHRVAATARAGLADEWVIFSRDHNAWWGANRSGYYLNVAEAGRYTKDEALRLTNPPNPRAGSDLPSGEPSDIPVPLSVLGHTRSGLRHNAIQEHFNDIANGRDDGE